MKASRFAASVLIIAAILALYRTLVPVNNTTVALTLLLAILGMSAGWGLAEATVASLVAVVGFNYWFLPPVGTLTIQDPQNWVALLAFLVTAVTASQLSARARRRAAEAEARRLEIERLYALVQAMMLSGNARKTIREFVGKVVQVFGCGVAAELEDVSVDAQRLLATAPVRLGGRPLGSLALIGPLPSEQSVRAIMHLMAITIEKARALEDAGHAEAARQSEVLKSALLDSLAHDIKTPLTSIKAAVTSLLGSAPGTERELLTIINEEADRLNQLAAEVIAMARIEAGKLHLEKRPVAAADLIAGALSECAAALKGRQVTVKAPKVLPSAEA